MKYAFGADSILACAAALPGTGEPQAEGEGEHVNEMLVCPRRTGGIHPPPSGGRGEGGGAAAGVLGLDS